MKRALFLSLLGFAPIFLPGNIHAALLPITKPTGSAYYADFDTSSLTVGYNYDTSSGVGTFNISNAGGADNKGEAYTSKSSSPGTGGVVNGNSSPPFAFDGFYSLNATVQNISGEWRVTGGSFSIEGSLFGGANTDLLLTGTLQTGTKSFGFDTSFKELQFLFTTGSGGNAAILSDFFGTGKGRGAIEVNWGAINFPNSFSLTQSWQNNGLGSASTFVPEPVFYPFAAAGMAMFGLVLARRKSVA